MQGSKDGILRLGGIEHEGSCALYRQKVDGTKLRGAKIWMIAAREEQEQ